MATEIATAYVALVPTTKGISSAIAREFGSPVSAAAAASGKKAGGSFASAFKGTLGAIGVTGLAIGVAGLVKSSVQLEASFSTTMRQIAVATNAPKAGIKELDRLAMQLGKQTVFSANEAADAMLQLAKGGLTPAQIKAGALKNTLTLATAGGLDLATAADSLVRTMGAFGLTAKDTGAAVSALAGAANASSAEVSDVTQALSQAGTEAHASGLSVQETTGILAAFADAGIVGSDAGTSLRTMLTRLVPQTDKAKNAMADLGLKFTDANGEFVSAEQMAERLHDALGGMSAAERSSALTTIFGADARRAANILVEEGAKGLEHYITQTSDLTQAQKLANAKMQGTEGAMKRLSGAVETAQLAIGKALAPVIVDASNKLTSFLEDAPIGRWSREFIGGVNDLVTAFEPLARSLFDIGSDLLPTFVDAAGSAADVLGGIAKIVEPIVSAFAKLPEPVRNLALAMGALSLAGRGLGVKMTAVSGAVSNMVLDMRTAPSKFGALKSRMAGASTAAKGLAGAAGLGALIVALGETDEKLRTLELAGAGGLIGFQAGGPIGAAIGFGVGALGGLAAALLDTNDAFKESIPAVGTYTDALNAMTGSITRGTRAKIAQTLEQSGLLKLAQRVGISTGSLVDVVMGKPGAWQHMGSVIGAQLDLLKGRLEDAQAIVNGDRPGDRDAAAARIASIQGQIDSLNKLSDGLKGNKIALDRDAKSIERTSEAARSAQIDVDGFNKLLRQVPPKVRIALDSVGVDTTRRQLVDMLNAANATPKQIRIALDTLGYDSTVNQLSNLTEAGKLTPKQILIRIRQEGADPTRNELIDIFEEQKKLPREVVMYLKQQGGPQLVADVRAAMRGVEDEMDRVPDEGVNVKLTAQANKVAQQLSRFNMARGGVVPYGASGVRGRDSVPAMLMPDEHVFTASDVKKAGRGNFLRGHRVMLAIRRMIQRNQLGKFGDVPAFANGGAVEPVNTVLQATKLQGLAESIALVRQLSAAIGSAYSRAISSMISKILTAFPTTGMLGFGGILTPSQLVRGMNFAQSQVGKPYGWGKVGPYAYDCSGFQSAVVNSAFGRYPYSRIGSTGTMPWSPNGGVGRYTIGWSTNVGGSGIGHTSGNIGGLNVESNGSSGVVTGSSALSPLSSMFYGLFHYARGGRVGIFDQGGMLRPGWNMAFNGTGANEFLVRRYAKGGKVTAAERRQQQHDDDKAIRQAVRAFRISGKQSARDTRSAFRELIRALKQVFGKDSKFVHRMENVADRMFTVAQRQDKVAKHLERANTKLDSLVDKQRQLTADVRQAFTHEAFGEDITSAHQARVQLRADRNDAQTALRQLRRLSRRGLDAGILKQIARTGNTALIRDLARMTPKQIKAFERDYKSRNKATQALGEFIGGKAFGPQIREQRQLVRKLEHSVNHWDHVIERMERKVERATERGTFHGVRAGMREREHVHRRVRRARAIR